MALPAREVLLERMPRRPRALSECALLLALLFAPGVLPMLAPGRAALVRGVAVAAGAVWAVALTRRRPALALAAVAAVAGTIWASMLHGPVAEGGAPLADAAGGSVLPWLVVRAIAVLSLIAVLLACDGQSPRHIGLDRARLGREVLWGGPVLVGAFAAHLVATMPIGAAMFLLGHARREAAQRVGALQGLLAGASLWQVVPALVVLAILEEVLFRGFLLPRVRSLTGRWWIAVALVQLLFGLGHVYEGVFAVAQTMVIGVYFSAVFLWRVHLASAIAAHAAFNAVMFGLVFYLQRSGFLERLQSLRP